MTRRIGTCQRFIVTAGEMRTMLQINPRQRRLRWLTNYPTRGADQTVIQVFPSIRSLSQTLQTRATALVNVGLPPSLIIADFE